jgi:hypothetical protein
MARKASEQPIWLLVALLLAVVVGIAMFNMINSGTIKFNVFSGSTGQESDRIAVESFCKSWIRPNEVDIAGNINPRASEPAAASKDQATDSFRKYGWLSNEKDPTTKAYIEAGPPSGCDCVVFLTSTVGSSTLPPTRAKQFLLFEKSSGSTYAPEACHSKSVCIGNSIAELNGEDLFGNPANFGTTCSS